MIRVFTFSVKYGNRMAMEYDAELEMKLNNIQNAPGFKARPTLVSVAIMPPVSHRPTPQLLSGMESVVTAIFNVEENNA